MQAKVTPKAKTITLRELRELLVIADTMGFEETDEVISEAKGFSVYGKLKSIGLYSGEGRSEG